MASRLLCLNHPYVEYYFAIFNKIYVCAGHTQPSAVKIDYRFCDCVNGISAVGNFIHYTNCVVVFIATHCHTLFSHFIRSRSYCCWFRLVLFIFWSDSFRRYYDFDSTYTHTYTLCAVTMS